MSKMIPNILFTKIMSEKKSDHNYTQESDAFYESLLEKQQKILNTWLEQKKLNEHNITRKQTLHQRNNEIKQRIFTLLYSLGQEIEQSTAQKSKDRLLIKNKYDKKNKNKDIISQEQYFYKIPRVDIDIRNVQVPERINDYQSRMDDNFEVQKNNMENDITKIKILIKLAQLDN